MPETVYKKIGLRTVDVIPYDICSVYFNRLNYKPRPVIQSYAASSDLSNRYNSDFFLRKNSPQYIIFGNGSIEKRDTSFLLRKREDPLHVTSRKISDTLIGINKQYIIPKDDNLLIMSAEIKYNMTGKLKNIIFRHSFINIRIFYEDGGSGVYRLILPELKHGVIINKRIISPLDAYTLFRYQGRKNEKITGFVIFPEKNDYQSEFRIKLTEYSFN